MNELILVTGATGTIGKEAVKQLILAKARVRAGIYNNNEVNNIDVAGVEFVEFDFHNLDSMNSALTGVDKVFLITPFVEDMVQMTMNFVNIAKTKNIKHIVRLSMMGADNASQTSTLRMHKECEDIIANSGIPYTILRPNWFMQDFLNYAPTIKNPGTYYAPINLKGSISFVDARDVATIGALALIGTNPGVGGVYVLTGIQSFTHRQVEDNFAFVLTKRVIFHEIKDEEYALKMKSYGLTDWQIKALLELYDEAETGTFSEIVSTTADILEKKPETFKTFVKAYAKTFR
ncbi:MAG: NmrA family NAD(P)-binding protein [Candidatus Woesearchaeota archaeon]|jgi:uncharacterized protein YbjT (DUF2867 family)